MSKPPPPRPSRSLEEAAAILLGLLTIAASVWAIQAAPLPDLSLWEYLIWVGTLVAALNLGITAEAGTADFSYLFCLAAFLALGLVPAIIITVIGLLASEVIRSVFHRQLNYPPSPGLRRNLIVILINLSRYSLSLIISGKLYVTVGGSLPIATPPLDNWITFYWPAIIGPLMVLYVSYLSCNYLLSALYLKLENRSVVQHYRRYWHAIVALEILPLWFSAVIASTALRMPAAAFAVFCLLLGGVMLITHSLSNARNRLEQRVRELDSLGAISQAVANSLDLPEVLEAIYQQTAQLMKARYFYVILYNAEEQELSFPLAYENGRSIRYPKRPFGAGLIEYVIQLRHPLLIDRDTRGLLPSMAYIESGPTARSWLGVPIASADRVLGVIAILDPDRSDAYTENDQNILTAVASHAAAAIHNAQMFISARQHASEMAILNSVTTAVSSTLNLDKVLNIIVTYVGRVMGNEKAAIFLAEGSGQFCSLAASHGLSQRYVEESRHIPLGVAGRAKVMTTRQSLIVNDVYADSHLAYFQPMAEAEGFRAFAEVPLQTHAETVGSLAVYYPETHRFTLTEIDLLNTFANQAAVAVANAKLYARTDEALARRVEQLAALEQIGRDLSASLDFDQVIHRVLERAVTATAATCGGIGLLSADQHFVRMTAAYGYSPEVTERILQNPYPAAQGIVGRSIRLAEPVCVNDVRTDPDYVASDPDVRSEMVIPIQNEEHMLGVIDLESIELGRFDQQSLDFARQLATQAAIALQNAQLYSQARSRLREMSILYDIGRQLPAILDLHHLGEELTRQMAQALNTTGCALELLHPESDQLELVSQYFSPDFEHAANTLDIDFTHRLTDYPATQSAIEYQQPLIVYQSDPDADPAELTLMRRYNIHALLTIPLVASSEVHGTVKWSDERPGHRFSEDELRLAMTLANQAAIAVQNARLFEERVQRINELSQLYAASLALTSSVEIDEVLHRISVAAQEITHADVVTLYLYDVETGTFYRASTPDATSAWAGIDLIRPNGLTRRVIDQATPIKVDDVRLVPDINPNVLAAGIRSFICAPMISKGKPMGALYVRSFVPNKFDAEDLQSVSALANQAAVAIENARLFEGVAEGRDKFQAILNSTNDGILMFDTTTRIVTVNPRLEEMWDLSRVGLEGRTLIDLLDQTDFQIAGKIGYTPEVLRALLEQVRAGQRTEWPREIYSPPSSTRQHYIERSGMPVLDASNRLIGWMLVLHDVSEEHELQQLRDDLTNMIIHDLRTPLSSVLGSLQLLDEMMEPRSPATPERQALTIATRSTRKLLDLVNSLLDISKLTSGQVAIELAPADMSSVIDLAIERLSSLASESSIIIRKQIANDLPIVLIDEDKISRVLINLLDNALKYTPTDGRITILAERWPTNDRQRPMVCCTVRDTGPGIPPEFRDRVFERFVQVTGRTGRRRGTGLGLSFCKLAVEAHGGKIWTSDGPDGNGSEFSFTLPATNERGFGMDD